MFVCIKADVDLMQPQFVVICFEILQVEEIALFEISVGCNSVDVYIRPFQLPKKKALAICVQSHNFSSSSVMLLSFSRYDYVAILKISF